MNSTWVGCAATNFRAGRPAGFTPTAIVIHRTGGSLQALRGRFADPASSLSAHYAVALDGRIEQYVAEADTAFHAGVVSKPTWTGIRDKVNPNFYTIGVEHEGLGTDTWPDAQLEASAKLVAEIASHWAIPVDVNHIVPHSAIRAGAFCPGPMFPADRYVDLARPPIGGATDEMGLAAAPPPTTLTITRALALPADQYYQETTKKDLIVLHFTAGTTAASAVSAWKSTTEHVATAYVVDIDGTVFETFPPSAWAYHLGIKGGTPVERRSIGIEIANVGPLQPSAADPNALNWWPKSFGQQFCTRSDSTKFIEKSYRGHQFFARYPDAQMDAVGRLVRNLCDRFGIPRNLSSANRLLECDLPGFSSFSGIATHVNFRQDKWDVGPAFDWDRLGL